MKQISATEIRSGQVWHDAPFGGLWLIKRVHILSDRVVVFGETEESSGGDWNTSIALDKQVLVEAPEEEEV